MKVFMIGGTGLLGSEAARELIARGHEVSSLALPPLPAGAVLPPEMKLEFGNYLEMSDEELKGHLNGCEGFVFAAGVDERVEGPAPHLRHVQEIQHRDGCPTFQGKHIESECQS